MFRIQNYIHNNPLRSVFMLKILKGMLKILKGGIRFYIGYVQLNKIIYCAIKSKTLGFEFFTGLYHGAVLEKIYNSIIQVFPSHNSLISNILYQVFYLI